VPLTTTGTDETRPSGSPYFEQELPALVHFVCKQDVNVVYLSSLDYYFICEDEVSKMDLGPKDAIFHKPKDSYNHLKALYIM
jgi:hypothetical protein